VRIFSSVVCRLPFMIWVPFYTPQTVTASGSIIGGHLTITGKAMCAKCELKQAEKCTNAIQVAGKDGKSTTYLMADNKVAKDFHGKVCKGSLDGVIVTGTVKKDGDKHVITASKIATK